MPKLPFVVADVVLIATAALIATRGPSPITPGALLAITLCVIVGAALLVVPFLANYARRQDAELTERQNQIAALARTTAESAEQISIVASGLNTIAQASKQNLESLGELPARLQERIDNLTQQIAKAAPASRKSAQEDTNRLDAAVENISRALAQIETATKTKNEAIAQAEDNLATALALAVTQIDTLVASASTAVERLAAVPVAPSATPPAPTVAPSTSGKASRNKTTSQANAQSAASESKATVKQPTAASEAPVAIAALTIAAAEAAAEPTVVTPSAAAPATADSLPAASAVEPISEAVASTPALDDPALTPAPVPEFESAHNDSAVSAEVVPPSADVPAPVPPPEPESAEPEAASTEETREPFIANENDDTDASPFTASEPSPDDVPVNEQAVAKPVRPRKSKPADDGFDLGLTPDPSEQTETAVTSDGFTRLIATAYIGIGNKLYIRGNGPGLSWDKGVALQFVSIGKWRWETPDATAPISVKLYKNDQVECLGLGGLTLEPGRQHEVNAGF
ncbi:MAG: hypothetical protein ABW223_01215 [Rariglobus sp.]